MKRRKPLRADPEKVREFQRRAAENSQLSRRKPLGRGERKAPGPDSRAQPVRFQAKEAARRGVCFRCRVRKADHWHHWTPQQHIRVYVRGLRLPETDARRLLRRLLRDERNLSRACRSCHLASEFAPDGRFTWEDVPGSAVEFAAELGPEWSERIRILYPAAGTRRS